MNREELMTILPHRDNMMLLDEGWVEDDTAHGRYTVRGDEFFLKGHFPGNPIVPGVILCEILAQSVCVLLADAIEPGMTPMYTGLNNVRFRAPVRPGDTVETECKVTRVKKPFYFATGTLTVNGQLSVKADFSFAVTGG